MNGSVTYEGLILQGGINVDVNANLEELTVYENGIYNPSEGKDGFSKVTVDVPAAVLDDITITENGHYTPPIGVDGYNDIVVSVPHPAPVLNDITITENGSYQPPTGVDGYDNITVNVLPTLDDITITENGSYQPPTGTDGYNEITVNVPLPANGIYKQTLSNLPSHIATFTGADAPIDSLKTSIVGVQSGSGDPSPSNIRPISGWSSCEVNKWGFNWWDEQWEQGKYDTDTGEKTPVSTRIRSKGKIPMLPNTDYYTTKTIITLYFDEQGNYLKNVSGTAIPSDSIFTTPSGIAFMAWHSTTAYGNVYNNDICINLSKTTGTPKNGDYVAYSGNTYTIPFKDSSDNPITVYGGGIDITGGKLNVTHANIASYNGETINEPWISSEDVYTQGATPTTGAQVVYPLTTPIVYDFDPLALRSNGVTNISVNCGEVTECKYYSETP